MSYLYFQYIPRTGPDALPDWACEPVPMPVDSSLKFIAPFHGPLLPLGAPAVTCTGPDWSDEQNCYTRCAAHADGSRCGADFIEPPDGWCCDEHTPFSAELNADWAALYRPEAR